MTETTARVRWGVSLRGVDRFENVAAGRAGHEGVVERADHVEHERPPESHVDIQRLEQFVPSIRDDEEDDGEDKDRSQEQAGVGLMQHRPDAAIDQRIRQARRSLADDLRWLDRLGLAAFDVPISLPQIARRSDDVWPLRAIRGDQPHAGRSDRNDRSGHHHRARRTCAKSTLASSSSRGTARVDPSGSMILKCPAFSSVESGASLVATGQPPGPGTQHAIRPGHVVQHVPDAENRDAPSKRVLEPFLGGLAHVWGELWGKTVRTQPSAVSVAAIP